MLAIFKKEWLKTKYILITFFVVSLISLGHFIVSIDNIIEFTSPEQYINGIVYYEKFSFKSVLFINMFFAALLGFYQYYKERENGRLRLHLHLPYSYFRNINVLVIFGISTLVAIFLIEYLLFLTFASSYLPTEVITTLSSKFFITFLISIAIYLSAPSYTIEPNKLKIIASYILLTLVILYEIDINSGFFSHEGVWIFFIWIIFFQLATLFLSFYRYTKGYIK